MGAAIHWTELRRARPALLALIGGAVAASPARTVADTSPAPAAPA